MKIKLFKLKSILKTSIILLLLFLVTAFPQISVKGAISGLKTFTRCVLPSLFPFMVISKYIIYSNTNFKIYRFISKIFNISDDCAEIMLLGSLSGYPTGATLVYDMTKKKE